MTNPAIPSGPPGGRPAGVGRAAWASTMRGHVVEGVQVAHADSSVVVKAGFLSAREEREAAEERDLAAGATRAARAGNRLVAEAPDPFRTCFERDRDRVLHSSAFRRLAGKTQVFIYPEDHQRTRLTHALEVAQVAVAICRAARLNTDLAFAAAISHDCGHGPSGHPSEDVFSAYLEEGFDHAPWGADVVLAPLNLCEETLDAVRNHSWARPAPATAEGEVVSWADRIAYVCHDWEDAASAGVVSAADLPAVVRERCGTTRSAQLSAFVGAVTEAVHRTGRVGMEEDLAEALAAFRSCNYERIYMRPDSLKQAKKVRRMLSALVEHYGSRPGLLPADLAGGADPGGLAAFRASVTYVAGMTDRYAIRSATRLLQWPESELP